jgi:hypothetical protein
MFKKHVRFLGGIKRHDVKRTKPSEMEQLKEEQDIRAVHNVLEERERKLREKREEKQRKHDEKLLADLAIFQQQLQDGQGKMVDSQLISQSVVEIKK